MKRYFFVVFLVFLGFPAYAVTLSSAIDSIEKEWAGAYYGSEQGDPSPVYQKLLLKTQALAKQFPSQAEPLLWQAIIIATDADHQSPLKALEQITRARELLEQVLAIDSNGLNGSAHVTLGSLYYMTPSWPIAFGDVDKADALFHAALKINPDSIEANYFYGDFLLSQNKSAQAEPYFKKALSIPPRKNQLFADKSLQQQAALALNNTIDRKVNHSKEMFLSRFNNAEEH